ncbi:MAG: hypothetical protein AAF846_28510 [Chloroflexota bacterium]
MNDPKVSELTVSQLRDLIKATVQEAMMEVLIEINTIAEAEADLLAEAEIADYLRSSMQGLPLGDFGASSPLDD